MLVLNLIVHVVVLNAKINHTVVISTYIVMLYVSQFYFLFTFFPFSLKCELKV